MARYLPAVYGADSRIALRSVSDFEQVSAAQVLAVQNNLLTHHQGAILVIVGDLSVTEVEPLLKSHIAGFPLAKPSEVKSNGLVMPAEQVIRVEGQQEERTDIRYVFANTLTALTDENYYASEVMIEALDKRLRQSLREESGLTYGVDVFQKPRYFNEQQWLLHIRFSTDPNKEKEAIAALEASLVELVKKPFTEKEVNEARARVVEMFKQYQASNSGHLNDIANSVLYQIPLEEYNDFDTEFEALSVEKINQLMQRFVSATKVVTIHHP
jgi:predicted Zn-dependent peptidase